MSQQIIIKGATGGVDPGTAYRLDAEDFVKNEKQWSLYVQAMQRLYDSAEDQDDSHFQIGGIHGLPYVPWNGAKLENPPGGYCQHGTTIFSTWHRPYCALYEQVLQGHAADIAADIAPDPNDEWKRAAASLRLPFWDWARHPLPPKQFYDTRQFSELTIALPGGKSKKVPNPLLGYRFKSGQGPPPPPPRNPNDPDQQAYYQILKGIGQRPATVRHPAADGSSNIREFESALNGDYLGIRSNMYRLLQYVDDWDAFSTQRKAGRPASTNSLESVHGTMHDNIGSTYGHMGQVPYAAFDALFWLHHSNVDRMLALWQAIHYNSWIPNGTRVNENTQLSPFWTETTRFWTSAQCRTPTALKYNYVDFDGIASVNPEALSEAIRQRVKDLYLDEETFPGFPRLARTLRTAAAPAQQAPIAAASAPESDRDQHIEWTTRIRAKKDDLVGVRSILIFVGGVPDHSEGYSFGDDQRYAGSYNPFVNPFPDHCENCIETADNRYEGFVHMNYNLLKHGIDVNDVGAVEEYLRDNLYWIPQSISGEDINPEDLKSLEVTVLDTQVSTVGAWGNVPIARNARKHNGITFDKPGGRVRAPGFA